MKMKILAASICAAACGTAGAQAAPAGAPAVSIYGVLDGGLAYTNKSPTAAGGSSSLMGFGANGESPSIFGLKGSMDLGGGLKAQMDLEGHFLTSTGLGEQWGGLFGRQANLGVSGSFGTVTLGTQYSPAVLAFAATDPRGLKESFSGLMNWAFSQTPVQGGASVGQVGATPGYVYNTNSVIDVFLKNTVSYSVQMPMGWMSKTDGLNFAVAYAPGGVAGANSANRVIALGITYSSPLTLSFAYQSENGGTADASGTSNTKVSVGAGYAFGPATIKVDYLDNKGKNAATGTEITHYKVVGVGADLKASEKDTVTIAYYDGKNSDATDDTAKSLIVSDDHAINKYFTMYGLLAQNKGGTGVSGGSSAYNGDNFAAPPIRGQTSFALQLGLKFAF